MSEESKPQNQALVDLHRRLLGHAEGLGLQVADAPSLAGRSFDGALGSDAASISDVDLPDHAMALRIDRQSIVLCLLPETPEKDLVDDCLRKVRNQCVVARSFLRKEEVLDLQCILVGPRGSDGAEVWMAIAMAVDRDDRVARKFSWLRPMNSDLDERCFDELVKRTFLARPWSGDGMFTMAALDSLSRVAALLDGEVPRNTADQWIKIGLSEGLDNDQIVQQLVSTWAQRGQ